jgi:hypothetical protein
VSCNDVTERVQGKTPARIAKNNNQFSQSSLSGSARFVGYKAKAVRKFYTGIAPLTICRLHFATCIPFTLRANSVSFFERSRQKTLSGMAWPLATTVIVVNRTSLGRMGR